MEEQATEKKQVLWNFNEAAIAVSSIRVKQQQAVMW